MTLSHEDANARLLDLIYGEAAPAQRAELEAHVATCARCTADLAALGDTRVRVRAALDDDAPVPPRVHAHLLEAARQALAPAAPVRATAAPARAGVPVREPSIWERLRGRWTLPTFATVGALAVVAIASKVFLEPQHTMERGREAATGAPPPGEVAWAPAPAVAAQRKMEEKKEAKTEDEKAPHNRVDEPSPEAPLRRSPGSLGGGFADALKHGHGIGMLGATSSERIARSRAAGGSGAVAARPAQDDDKPLDGLVAPATPAAPAPRGAYAQPPSGWKGGPSAGKQDDLEEAEGAGAAAEAASDSRAAAKSTSSGSTLAKKKAAPAAEPAAPPVAAAALVRRADQLFATRHWSEAVAAYRELLRRYPDAELEPRWRARVAQAQGEADAVTASRKAAAKAPARSKSKAAPAAE